MVIMIYIYIKTKIKTYGDNVNTNFHGIIIPKENTSCKYLSLIMLDSFIRVNKKHCSQTLLEECIYEKKKNTQLRLIMKLIVTLITILLINLKIMNLMNNLLKVKTAFKKTITA